MKAKTENLTSWQMAEIEPRLIDLFLDVQKASFVNWKAAFCANAVWYKKFKPRLERLVGFEAANKKLRTMQAYDCAYEKLYSALPECRNCNCL